MVEFNPNVNGLDKMVIVKGPNKFSVAPVKLKDLFPENEPVQSTTIESVEDAQPADPEAKAQARKAEVDAVTEMKEQSQLLSAKRLDMPPTDDAPLDEIQKKQLDKILKEEETASQVSKTDKSGADGVDKAAQKKPQRKPISTKPHPEGHWYKANTRSADFERDFKGKTPDELVARLNSFNAKGVPDNYAETLKDQIIRMNPSVYKKDGSIRTDANWDKLDIPNNKWLNEEFFPNTAKTSTTKPADKKQPAPDAKTTPPIEKEKMNIAAFNSGKEFAQAIYSDSGRGFLTNLTDQKLADVAKDLKPQNIVMFINGYKSTKTLNDPMMCLYYTKAATPQAKKDFASKFIETLQGRFGQNGLQVSVNGKAYTLASLKAEIAKKGLTEDLAKIARQIVNEAPKADDAQKKQRFLK